MSSKSIQESGVAKWKRV